MEAPETRSGSIDNSHRRFAGTAACRIGPASRGSAGSAGAGKWWWILGVLATSLACAQPLVGQYAQASVQIVISIEPIAMLRVADAWEVVGRRSRGDGTTEVSFRTSYGVTCIVPGSVIRATLTGAPSPGTRVSVFMTSRIGESAGWVELQPGTPVELVREPRGNERSQVDLLVRLPDGASPDQESAVATSIVFTIDQVGPVAADRGGVE